MFWITKKKRRLKPIIPTTNKEDQVIIHHLTNFRKNKINQINLLWIMIHTISNQITLTHVLKISKTSSNISKIIIRNNHKTTNWNVCKINKISKSSKMHIKRIKINTKIHKINTSLMIKTHHYDKEAQHNLWDEVKMMPTNNQRCGESPQIYKIE